jgi:enoyl-CoA hydratase/carnithine racemase
LVNIGLRLLKFVRVMSYTSLSLELSGPLACVTLCRPQTGNLVDAALVRELAEACEAIAAAAPVRAVIVTAEGDVFSRGWDWQALSAAAEGGSLLDAARARGMTSDPFGCLAALPSPVVCAVNGDAVGAGLELALACDIRIAAEGARFSVPELAMGLLPMAGGLQRLARLVGRGKALEMALTGDPVDAEEALRIGLVSAVASPDRLLAEAEAIANRIAERGPIATAYAKEAIARGLDLPLQQALRFETDLTVILQTTEDRAEGVRAFLEKRKPEFKGR